MNVNPPSASEIDTVLFSERTKPSYGWVASVLLALILLLGAFFRLTGVEWDDNTHLHPDERFLTMVETALSLPGATENAGAPPPGCDVWGGYFDTACSPLNPYNHDFGLFVYGTFPIFLTRVIGAVLDLGGYDQIHLVGRVLSALFDLSTVLLVYWVGRRLYGVRVALLGAFFLAASVLDIQQSHFFTVDTFTNVPIVIAFWYALDIAEGRKWPAFVFAGLAFGLALAGRINIAPFAVVLIAASALRAFRALKLRARAETSPSVPSLAPTEELPDRTIVEQSVGPLSFSVAWHRRRSVNEPGDPTFGEIWRSFAGLALAAVVTLFVFRVMQPYAANGPNLISPSLPKIDLSRGSVNVLFDVALSWAGGVNPKFSDNMSYVSDLVTGKLDYPPGHQWTARTPYLFPLENMVEWGLGLPLGLAAWAGFAVALYELVRHRKWQHLLMLVWVGITFGYSGQQFVKTMRYFLQIYPFLALFAGFFLVWLWDKAAGWQKTKSPQESGPSVGSNPLRYVLQGGALAAAIIVVGYTLFWASAFRTIYVRPHTRVAASRWMFQNVPPGSIIANEHWDDAMPVRVDGKDPFGGMYRGLPSSQDGEMHWYDEDTPEKRAQAIQWIDEADYIVLSSNRLYGSIARLPMRYPMTVKYYQWLFSGELGYERVATFTSRPELFGLEINDDNAEEAFTVYDHPKVMIFRKSPGYSHSVTEALFNSVDLSEVYRFTPVEASQARTALLLSQDDASDQMRGGTWSEIFDPANWINRVPVIGWLGMIELMGWISLPIAFVVFRGMADKGYLFSKTLGILIPAWGAWMLASLHAIPFGRFSILLVLLLIALASAVCVRFRWRDLRSFFRREWRVIGVEEILLLIFFGGFLAIRFGNPDLWHPWYGGEKPMDFAFLNAIVKSTWFPPYDPWFAGGYINYYYFGQLITAVLVRLSGIVPEVGYNLALATFFGLTAAGAFGVVYNLVAMAGAWGSTSGVGGQRPGTGRAVFAGTLGALFVAVIGNLGELILIGQTFVRIGGGESKGILGMATGLVSGIVRVITDRQPFDIPIGWWYWNASRVIPETINEFPFFTFLYGDLHAHLMALAFTMLVLGLAVSFVMRERGDEATTPFWPHWAIGPSDVAEVGVMALAVGALRAINFADYPTYMLVLGCALGIGEYGRRRRIDLAGLVAVGWRLVGVILFATLFFQPFVSRFATAYLSAELWKGTRTSLAEYLVVHGIFLFILGTWLVWQALDTKAARGPLRFGWLAARRIGRLDHLLDLHRAFAAPPGLYEDLCTMVTVALVLIEIVLLLAHAFLFALAFPLLVAAGLLVLRPELAPDRRFMALLVAAGLAMTLMVEVITYKGDIGRMNTVFKFYLQVWVFFGIVAAAGLALMVHSGRQDKHIASDGPENIHIPSDRTGRLPAVWWATLGVLLFCGLLYPVLATRAKVNDRFVAGSPPGLNGMDYMQEAIYADQNQDLRLEYDREAIEWLRANVTGSPVILEGTAPLYHWGSRISINTGLPTVIGWDWHEKQQRSIIDGAIIDRRIADVRTIYETSDIPQAVQLLGRFQVGYVYVGDLERAFYGAEGLTKFEVMARDGQLDLVYQNEHVKVYRVKM